MPFHDTQLSFCIFSPCTFHWQSFGKNPVVFRESDTLLVLRMSNLLCSQRVNDNLQNFCFSNVHLLGLIVLHWMQTNRSKSKANNIQYIIMFKGKNYALAKHRYKWSSVLHPHSRGILQFEAGAVAKAPASHWWIASAIKWKRWCSSQKFLSCR